MTESRGSSIITCVLSVLLPFLTLFLVSDFVSVKCRWFGFTFLYVLLNSLVTRAEGGTVVMADTNVNLGGNIGGLVFISEKLDVDLRRKQ